jgi:hypothetical protein
MAVSYVAEGLAGRFYYFQQQRMLAKKKQPPQLDPDYAGVVLSVVSYAYAVAGFDQDYLSASHSEVAGSGQACDPGTKYQDRLFVIHAGNCNDQTTE